MTKIQPLGNRVLVRRQKAATSKGGILLPDTAQEKPKIGTVESVGPGKINEKGTLETMHVAVGDKVLFSSYAGTEVKNQESSSDDELLIISQDDILGIIK